MKNKVFKILQLFVIGMSIASCDLKAGTAGLSKISSYHNEVSYSEFSDKITNFISKSKFNDESYNPSDMVLKAEVKGTFDQKVTNSAYKNSKRNVAKLKTNADAKISYDADNQVLDGFAKVDVSLKEENALLGKADASYKNTVNAAGQPINGDKYAFIDKDDEFYYSISLGGRYSFNDYIAEFVRDGVKELIEEIEEGIDEDTINEYIGNLNSDSNTSASLKYYVDNQVFTIVLDVDTRQNLKYKVGDESQENYVIYGRVHSNLQCVAQLKVGKTIKLATRTKSKMEADFYESRSSILSSFIPTVSGLITGDCAKGDYEVIDIELAAGVSLEQKSVSNKKVNLSDYREIE